jgi:hypothetical protein
MSSKNVEKRKRDETPSPFKKLRKDLDAAHEKQDSDETSDYMEEEYENGYYEENELTEESSTGQKHLLDEDFYNGSKKLSFYLHFS